MTTRQVLTDVTIFDSPHDEKTHHTTGDAPMKTYRVWLQIPGRSAQLEIEIRATSQREAQVSAGAQYSGARVLRVQEVR
jgi:hypothetical protein